MKNRSRELGMLAVSYIVFAAGCNRALPIRPYSQQTYADAESAPLLIIGVGRDDKSIGTPVPSPLLDTKLQLHEVTVQIESVLRGNMPDRQISLYYFAFEFLNTSHPPLILGESPSRRLIALRRDGAVYRAAMDGRNCAPRILTDTHPSYKPGPGEPVSRIDIELNTTRGESQVDDEQFAQEIDTLSGVVGNETFYAGQLDRLISTEVGPVKVAACRGLEQYSLAVHDQVLRGRTRYLMKGAGCK